jgi:hypothetical protein
MDPFGVARFPVPAKSVNYKVKAVEGFSLITFFMPRRSGQPAGFLWLSRLAAGAGIPAGKVCFDRGKVNGERT